MTAEEESIKLPLLGKGEKMFSVVSADKNIIYFEEGMQLESVCHGNDITRVIFSVQEGADTFILERINKQTEKAWKVVTAESGSPNISTLLTQILQGDIT